MNRFTRATCQILLHLAVPRRDVSPPRVLASRA